MVTQTTGGMQQARAMRAVALKKYDCHRLTEGEGRIIIREGLGAAVSIMIVGEGQGLEDGGQGGGGEIVEETWKPRVVCLVHDAL